MKRATYVLKNPDKSEYFTGMDEKYWSTNIRDAWTFRSFAEIEEVVGNLREYEMRTLEGIHELTIETVILL